MVYIWQAPCNVVNRAILYLIYLVSEEVCRSGNSHVKHIFVACLNHKNEKTKYILQRIIANSQHIFVHTVSQHS